MKSRVANSLTGEYRGDFRAERTLDMLYCDLLSAWIIYEPSLISAFFQFSSPVLGKVCLEWEVAFHCLSVLL